MRAYKPVEAEEEAQVDLRVGVLWKGRSNGEGGL